MLTGRHPNRYGTFAPGWSMRPEEITIGHILSRAGYACGHFGKWHVGAVKAGSPVNPKAMGFEEYVAHDNFFEMGPVLSRNGAPPEKFDGESSEVVIDEAIRFIDKSKRAGRPFFVLGWFGSPHEPYIGLENDLALYDDLPRRYQDQFFELTDLHTGEQTRRPLREVLRERYAEITAMDRAIGNFRGPREPGQRRHQRHAPDAVRAERELFDVRSDPAEKHNLIAEQPEIAGALERRLRDWQGSVLNSLTAADYRG